MKKIAIGLFLLIGCLTASSQELFLTNIEEAKAKAEENSQNILLVFSGSDWCGNCIRLEKSLFMSNEFKSFANENLVLLKADFPMKKKNKLSEEQTKRNEILAEQYNNKGEFPLVLMLSSNGEVIGRMKQPLNSVSAYINNLKSLN